MITSTPERMDHALVTFQHTLQGALHSFLNGNFVVPGTPRGALLRPLRLAACRVPWNLLAAPLGALQQVPRAHNALDRQCKDLIDRGQAQRWLWFEEAALVLSALYGVLDHHLAPAGEERTVHPRRPYAPANYPGAQLHPVRRLASFVRQELEPFILGFYLHGSLSTEDFTGFSDVDDFIVVRRETVTSGEMLAACAEACVRAARFLYEFDILQHHRHYVVSEVDLRRYSTSFLPPEVLEYATAISAPPRLDMRVIRDDQLHRQALLTLAQRVQAMAGTVSAANAWRLKYLVAAILLMPVLFLESRGTYCYKKFSFALARDAFGKAWGAVEIATEIRGRWRHPGRALERLLRRAILGGLGNPALFERLISRAASPPSRSIRALIARRRFGQAAAEFAQAVLHPAPGECVRHGA